MKKLLKVMQTSAFAAILKDIALAFFTSLLIEQIASEHINWINATIGLLVSFSFWTANLLILIKYKNA